VATSAGGGTRGYQASFGVLAVITVVIGGIARFLRSRRQPTAEVLV
jgi:hypothetical protein